MTREQRVGNEKTILLGPVPRAVDQKMDAWAQIVTSAFSVEVLGCWLSARRRIGSGERAP